jgi:hypothetical protein|tara:strand:+ start:919 stop:1197 length:279 start_codon:yes stop_codon:yes gene_type:complete
MKLSYSKKSDLKISVDILRYANISMSGSEFMEYCLNSWRSTKDNYDSYYNEKYEKFINNPLLYFGTLDKGNLELTLQGLINFYEDKKEEDNG